MRDLLPTAWTLLLIAIALPTLAAPRPNIVVIFTDDQGYEDLGCFGSPKIKTPNLDQMAAEGLKLNDFYVTTSVCSASRASLLTGLYPSRTGVNGAFFPDIGGLSPEQITLAEVLRTAGYQTGCFGKWHLGDQDQYLPTNQGFDTYYGIPYSNDMYIGPSQRFAEDAVFAEGYDLTKAKAHQQIVIEHRAAGKRSWEMPPEVKEKVPVMRGHQVVEYPADQATLTQRYFDEAIAFAAQSGEQPFFLFITPSMPHVPLFAAPAFAGKSERGLYGDVIEEIDHHVGRLIQYLRTSNQLENTIVVFTSDNGPWLRYEDHAGSAGPLRGGKFNSYEGGVRVPCVVSWPSKIPAGVVSNQAVSSIDLFPTLATLAGAELPNDLDVDGMDLTDWLSDPTQPLAARPLFVYWQGKATAVRLQDYKLLPQGDPRTPAADPAQAKGPELFDLRLDPGEHTNLADRMPELVQALEAVMAAHQ